MCKEPTLVVCGGQAGVSHLSMRKETAQVVRGRSSQHLAPGECLAMACSDATDGDAATAADPGGQMAAISLWPHRLRTGPSRGEMPWALTRHSLIRGTCTRRTMMDCHGREYRKVPGRQ